MPMNRTLIALGIVLVLGGVLWPALRRLPLFRLPGDFVFHRGGFTFFLPLTTMLLLSLAVSLLAWLLRR